MSETIQSFNFICTFAVRMYSLEASWVKMFGKVPKEWDGQVICVETDTEMTLLANKTQGFLSAYTFTLVKEGFLICLYNGKKLTLQADDLYIYSPGLPVTVLAASDNYRGICLMADETTTFESPIVHDLVYLACKPIVQLHEPKLTLSHEAAVHIDAKMREIITYLRSDHIYKAKILQMLYAVFLLDLQNEQQKAISVSQTSQRVEEIFIGFIRLLPHHFMSHRDIAFYAKELNISSVYLSRVVRQVTGRTVVDYINQMLLMESLFLLRTSSLSISQIADRLHFADTPSFSKFFSRMKGVSPRAYREME